MYLRLRLGRIRYINVLPIYYALEQAYVPNGFELIPGTPAELNASLHQGRLDASAISSVEYARHHRDYLLLPDLSISAEGDAGSVLFFSRVPFMRLSGLPVLLSAASATAAALVKIILYEHFGARPLYYQGVIHNGFPDGYYGLLAIGDEALRLKVTHRYPYFLDLGRAWYELTGLPFVFGLWAVRRDFCRRRPAVVRYLCQTLIQARNWGLAGLEEICRHAAASVNLPSPELYHYFRRLNFCLGPRQKEGLANFYRYLHGFGVLSELPPLEFVQPQISPG